MRKAALAAAPRDNLVELYSMDSIAMSMRLNTILDFAVALWDFRGGGRGFLARQFVGQRVGAVDMAQRFQNPARIHLDGAADGVVVDEIPRQGLDVAVEDDAHHLAGFVHDGTSGVAADDVGGLNDV